MKRFLLLMILLFPGLFCAGPDVVAAPDSDTLRWEVSARQSLADGNNTPFWLVNNLQGLGSPRPGNGWVTASAEKGLNTSHRFSWGAGIELAGMWRNRSAFQVHKLYAELKWRSLGLLVGADEIQGELNDPRLSSGNLLFSGNALPVPQIRAGLPRFTPVPGLKGWVGVKGYVAYGKFTDSGWQKDWAAPGSKRTSGVLFHSKGLWLQGGRVETFPLQGELGIEMATQFGGTVWEGGRRIKLPSGLKAWLRAFWPTRTEMKTLLGDQRTTEGNMAGTYTMALSWLPSSDWSVKAYYEHFFEDQSQMTFEYGWKDGLWGVQGQLPRNPFVSQVVFEFLDTRDQTGAVNNDSSDKVPEQVSGRDNYYNHSLYSGWQHWGLGLGNPLLVSPVYNDDRILRFRSNRVRGFHLGISGEPTSRIAWRALFSLTSHWGSYAQPLPDVEREFNWLAELSWTPRGLEGWKATVGVAGDSGRLLGRSMGVALTVAKSGKICF